MQISINLRRGELVRQGMQDLNSEVPKIGRRGIRTVMDRIKRRMQAYPPERPGQSRKISHPILGTAFVAIKGRTGRLGRSWVIERVGDTGYMIKNDARNKYGRRYGKWVVGDAYGTSQAWMHQGRWQVFRDVTEEELAKLPHDVEQEITMVARRNNP